MSVKDDEGIIERSWSFIIAAATIHASAWTCWILARHQRFKPRAIRKENGHHWVRGCGKPFLKSLPEWHREYLMTESH